MNPKDHKLITEEELAEAIREMFLKPISTRAGSQNTKPTQKEVNTVLLYIIPLYIR